jgi:hypothetical protein
MATYSFQLTIAQKDLDQLVANGFNFATQKSDGSAYSAPIQWFSVLLEGTVITVSFVVGYEAFFTTTSVVAGATIVQGNSTPAAPGNSYKYGQASWSPSPNLPPVTPSQIGILHDYQPITFRNFGINQIVTVNGVSQKSPIAAAPIPNAGGFAIFAPLQTVTLYFTLAKTSGFVLSSQSSGWTLTLAPNVPQGASYQNGVWGPGPTPSGAVARSLAGPPAWYGKFWVKLAGEVNVGNFDTWFENTVKHTVARIDGPATQQAFLLEVISDKNRADEILHLKGKWFEGPLIHVPLEPGVEEVVGRRVRIDEIVVAITPFEELLKLLPAGSGAASHSH